MVAGLKDCGELPFHIRASGRMRELQENALAMKLCLFPIACISAFLPTSPIFADEESMVTKESTNTTITTETNPDQAVEETSVAQGIIEAVNMSEDTFSLKTDAAQVPIVFHGAEDACFDDAF